jgi:hypothetical protein
MPIWGTRLVPLSETKRSRKPALSLSKGTRILQIFSKRAENFDPQTAPFITKVFS